MDGLRSSAIASRTVVLPTSPPPRIRLIPGPGRQCVSSMPRKRQMDSFSRTVLSATGEAHICRRRVYRTEKARCGHSIASLVIDLFLQRFPCSSRAQFIPRPGGFSVVGSSHRTPNDTERRCAGRISMLTKATDRWVLMAAFAVLCCCSIAASFAGELEVFAESIHLHDRDSAVVNLLVNERDALGAPIRSRGSVPVRDNKTRQTDHGSICRPARSGNSTGRSKGWSFSG